MKNKYKILALLTALLVISLVSKHIDNQKAISGQFCGLDGFSSKWCQLKWVAEREPNRLPVSKDSDNPVQIIMGIAQKNQVNPQLMVSIAKCESGFIENVRGVVDSRDRGAFQINRRWNPSVTDECADNFECSAEWAANEIKNGRVWKWEASKACWNNA